MSWGRRQIFGFCGSLTAVVLALGLPGGLGEAAGQETAPDPERLFSPASVWNTPLADHAPLDATSESRTGALATLIEVRQQLPRNLGGGHPSINADKFSTPIYRVSASTPRVPVRIPEKWSGRKLREIMADGVPIPAGAAPAEGSNGHMTIYQPATDTLWEFYRARKPLLPLLDWEADWGGVMQNASQSLGYYDGNAWPGVEYPEGWNWGATATSLPVAAGTVTRKELAAGRIDHALAASVANACREVFSWPAQRTDGTSYGLNCMPEGSHLRLDPSVDVESLGLHPVAEQLALAAQRYGIIVRDRTRVSFSFFLESPPPGEPSPYTGPGGFYEGTPPWKVLEGFPWRDLQLLPLQLCTSAPCP